MTRETLRVSERRTGFAGERVMRSSPSEATEVVA